ncbi:hypothetical protein GCM10023155_29970 [Bremerella cremea]
MPEIVSSRMAPKSSNPDFLNGVPELLLLRLLARRPMYGYELVQAIRLASDGELEFGEGCIYPILHRLERDKKLASKRETVGGRSRVVYRVTPAGRKKLEQQQSLWEQTMLAIEKVLHGEDDRGNASIS